MSPTQPESAGIPLPAPEQSFMPEIGETPPTGGETAAAPEKASSPPMAAPPTPTIPLSTAQMQPGSPPASTSTAAAMTAKLMTDDDLIEKEWVNKAKQIVERTRDDPHKQSEYMTVFKADYIKKHYGKTIKLSR